MSLIARYTLRAHIGPFLFGISIAMLLFLLQFLMKRLDQLVGKGLGMSVIAELIVLSLAPIAVLSVPMGVLFATLMGFGNLASNNEITVIQSSGGSLLRMMRPIVIAGIVVTAAVFWFNDYVLPDANHRAHTLITDIERKKPTFAIEEGLFSSHIEGYSILARAVDSSSGVLRGVTIYDYTKFNRLTVVSADSGIVAFSPDFTKLIVTLHHGETHQINQQNYGDYRRVQFTRHQMAINASGFAFTPSGEGVLARGDREMCIADMRQMVEQSRHSMEQADTTIHNNLDQHFTYLKGTISDVPTHQQQATTFYEATERVNNRTALLGSTLEGALYQRNNQHGEVNKFLVEIHKKYAIPAACFVFIFVGCPLGILTRRGDFGIGAAISLGFYVLYWACLVGGEILADRGVIAPWLGMWLANILIGTIGIALTIRVSNGGFAWRFVAIRSLRARLFTKR